MKILVVFVLLFGFIPQSVAEPIGIEERPGNTWRAKYKSDSSGDRCSQMAPKIKDMARGFCSPQSMTQIGQVWCDEDRLCIFGLCNHYAFLDFHCPGGPKSSDLNGSEEEREVTFSE